MSNTGFEFDNTTGLITWQGMIIAAPGGVVSSKIYTCPATVNVGDAVATTGADQVDKANASVVADRPVIGVVRAKPTSTTCYVQYYGECDVYAGLTPEATYFLSDTVAGAITTTPPSAQGSTVQEVGFARNATTLVVLIDPDYTLL